MVEEEIVLAKILLALVAGFSLLSSPLTGSARLAPNRIAILEWEPTGVSDWSGEWGEFRRVSRAADDGPRYDGRGLSISDCNAERCKVSLLVQSSSGHGGATGDLTIGSAENATALLHAEGVRSCSLALKLTSDSIVVSQESSSCSDFLTPGASFAGAYPLRTRLIFYDWDVPPCFADRGAGRLALCASVALAELRKEWTSAFWVDEALHPELGKVEDALDRVLASCDAAADAATCIDEKFRSAMASFEADEAAWYKKVEAPGDPELARRTARAIAGDYRHTFPNGDVEGEHFESTDSLHLEAEADGLLRYSIHLEFFNGHECNREGEAHFNSEGKFVDTQCAGSGHTCVFEIVPDGEGVRLEDPTGWCKMTDCGMRGGYNGAKFAFSDRVSSHQAEHK
jgi:hypothetical protein